MVRVCCVAVGFESVLFVTLRRRCWRTAASLSALVVVRVDGWRKDERSAAVSRRTHHPPYLARHTPQPHTYIHMHTYAPARATSRVNSAARALERSDFTTPACEEMAQRRSITPLLASPCRCGVGGLMRKGR